MNMKECPGYKQLCCEPIMDDKELCWQCQEEKDCEIERSEEQ